VSNELVFTVVEAVIKEVSAAFPDDFIHLGNSDVP
jgi:N-acetyl-beta-hexosaminidase